MSDEQLEEDALDVLYVSPERFRMTPQVGLACRLAWPELVAYLCRPSVGESKDAAGAWSPALYRDDVRRKSALVSVGALVVDVDENGSVEAIAEVLARYTCLVHETFSSTDDAPRCRIVLPLASTIDAPTYERAHAIVRRRLRAAGVVADDGAKDASRVSYAPVRRPGARYRFREVGGKRLDAAVVIASEPPPAPRVIVPPPAPEHRDAYVRGALRNAAAAVGKATAGMRHHTLCQEAFSLARLGLTLEEIEAALLPAFVAVAGERRELEGARAIRDAVRARGAA